MSDGLADDGTGPYSSTHALLGALALNGTILTAEIAAFTYMRRRFRLIYEPRSLSFFEVKRQPPLSSRLWGWPSSIWFADYRNIMNINGLDSYFFVRFLRMMVRVMLPIWLISWAVLLPLMSINISDSFDEVLHKFNVGNMDGTDNRNRYIGLLVLTWIFTIWIWWNIEHEMAHYVHVRQQYLVSPSHSSTAQARTVLVTGIPPEFLTVSALTRLFSHLPGGVRKVWINRDLRDIPNLHNKRLKACQMLESTATSLINKAVKGSRNRLINPAKFGDGCSIISNAKLTDFVSDLESRDSDTLMEELVSKHKRPSHWLPLFSWMPFSIPLLGKKVDTIEWACGRIYELNDELARRREVLARDTTGDEAPTTNQPSDIGAEKSTRAISGPTYPPANGAFILFNRQIAAHMAAQTLTHDKPYCMSNSLKYIEATPEDVIWKNLVMNPYRRRIRLVLSRTVGIVVMIVWTIPVSTVAIASRLQTDQCIGFGWYVICDYASRIHNFFLGVLCAALLTVLFMFVPLVFRILARWEGTTQRTHVELSIMNRIFVFNVISGLFLPALSTYYFSSASDVVADLSQRTIDPYDIVWDLTASSTFFLIFIMLQGLWGTAIGFLQAVPLAKYYVKITLFGSTPRSVYSIKHSPRTSDWGTLFPSMTLLVVITFGYSVIAPIINGVAFVTFFLLYMLYKYLFTWVNDHPPSSDTGGLFFPKAIQHVFVGLYVQQICLCTLFFLPLGYSNKPFAIPEGTLMISLIVFTAFFHHIIHNSYGPLIKFLPQTLATGNAGVGQGTHTAVAPQLRTSSSDVDATDHLNSSPPDSDQQPNEGAPLLPGDIADGDLERTAAPSFTNESRTPSPSPSAQPMKAEFPTEFSQPAAIEGQRIIWLPKDPLGLVHEIEEELTSRHILYSTEGAEMDSRGKVNVTSAPEEIRRAPMVARPRPCEVEGDEKRTFSLWSLISLFGRNA